MSSKDLHHTLAAIDAATECQRCGELLGSSPSNDFCGEDCQMGWHASRSTPLPWVDAGWVTIGWVDGTHLWAAAIAPAREVAGQWWQTSPFRARFIMTVTEVDE